LTSQEPTPAQGLDSTGDGAPLLITVLAAVTGAIAGWFAIRGIRRIRGESADVSRDAATAVGAAVVEPLASERSALPPRVEPGPPDQPSPSSVAGVPPRAPLAHASERTDSLNWAESSSGAVWTRPTKYLVGIGLVIFGALGLYWIRGVLPMLVAAGLIAFVVQPLIRWFQSRLRLPRGLSTILAYAVIVLMVLAIPLIVLPSAWSAINELRTVDTIQFYARADAALTRVLDAVIGIPLLGPIVVQSLEPLQALLASGAAGDAVDAPALDRIINASRLNLFTIGQVTGAITPLFSWLVAAAFAVLISVYLSSGRYSVRAFVLERLPPAYAPEIATLFDRIGWTWSSFLQGQLKLMFLIGFVVFIGNAALGNRYAAMLGLIAGVLEIVPTIGPILALIPGVLLALIFGSSWMGVSNLLFAAIVLLFYVVVQMLENQLVVPRVLGDAVELPPLVVLVGVLIGGSVGGILGALIAVPVVGTLKEVVGYLYGKIIEAPAIEAPPGMKPGVIEGVVLAARRLTSRVFRARA
jgi:predicted PurR-regulated permease PerM